MLVAYLLIYNEKLENQWVINIYVSSIKINKLVSKCRSISLNTFYYINRVSGVSKFKMALLDVDVATCSLFVCKSSSRQCRGRIQVVQRNFSSFRFRVWEADGNRSAAATCSPRTCSRATPPTTTLIPIWYRTNALWRDSIFQLIRPSIHDAKLHIA